MKHLAAGDVVDRFEVVGAIGRGAQATVYRVRHRVIGAEYALKLVTEPSGEDRARLLREGRAQATVRHPNLVPVLDVLTLGDDLGLLLELVDGPDLAGWIQGRVSSLAEIDRLAEGLFAGLEYAHASGVIHRDLKPSNILVDDPQGLPVARIVDFGLAKADDGETTSTRTGSLYGTPCYAAPEQIGGARGVDARADVFSLGAVLYELATGQRAFPDEDVLDVLRAVADERFLDPLVWRPDLPPRMADTIRVALRASRDRRWPDIAAFRAAWRGEEGVVAPEPAVAPVARRPASWVPVAIPVAIVVLAVAALGFVARPRDEVPVPASAPSTASEAFVARQDAPALPALVVADLPSVPVQAPPEPPRPAPRGVRSAGAVASSPTVAAPTAAAAVAPTVAAAPAEPAEAPVARRDDRAQVRLLGNAEEVALLGRGGEYVPAGAVAPGTYVVEARFAAGESRVEALRLEVRAGEDVEVFCTKGFRRCSSRRAAASGR